MADDGFIFLDKDDPDRAVCNRLPGSYDPDWYAKRQAKVRGVDGDGFCPRCLLPLAQCACKPRHGG